MNKQIEEIARIICHYSSNRGNCDWCGFKYQCSKFVEAEALYNAGYRKSTDVAREIFEEFKTEMRSRLHSVDELYKKDPDDFYGGQTWAYSAAIFALENIIKMKYES